MQYLFSDYVLHESLNQQEEAVSSVPPETFPPQCRADVELTSANAEMFGVQVTVSPEVLNVGDAWEYGMLVTVKTPDEIDGYVRGSVHAEVRGAGRQLRLWENSPAHEPARYFVREEDLAHLCVIIDYGDKDLDCFRVYWLSLVVPNESLDPTPDCSRPFPVQGR